MSLKLFFSRHTRQALIVTVLVTLLLTVFAGVAIAAPTVQDIGNPILDLIFKEVGLWGFGAVIAVVLQVLKLFGFLPDGWAGKLSIILNIAVYFIVTTAGLFGYDLVTDELQTILMWVVRIGELILSIFSSSIVYSLAKMAQAVKPVPVSRRLGYNRRQ